MKKVLLIVLGSLVGLIMVAVLVAFLFVNSVVKKGVETVGPKVTQVTMRLGSANISVFSGKGTLSGFFMGNPDGFKTPAAIQVGEVSVAVKPTSVLGSKVVIPSVRVVGPEITFEGSLKGSNLSKILENVQAFTGAESKDAKADKGAGQAGGKKLQVDDFVVTDGKIKLSATLLGGKAMTVPLPDIHLKDLGKDPEGITPGELTEKVFKSVFEGTTKAVAEALASVGKETVGAAKSLGEGAAKEADKAVKGIGDLFKKKK